LIDRILVEIQEIAPFGVVVEIVESIINALIIEDASHQGLNG
jgi:hypothetical protein